MATQPQSGSSAAHSSRAGAYLAGGLPPGNLREVASSRGAMLVLITENPGDRVLPMIREAGRERAVRILDLAAAESSDSIPTFNPLGTADVDQIIEILASQLSGSSDHDPNDFFRERAMTLLGAVVPVLAWLRDEGGVPLNLEMVSRALGFRWIWKLASQNVALYHCDLRETEAERDLAGHIPREIIWPIKSYLGELPGYDPALPLKMLASGAAGQSHCYTQCYFNPITQLASTHGRFFRPEFGNIDMRRIVLKQRIFVVRLPGPECADDTLAALGRFFMASLQVTLAELLGKRSEACFGGGGMNSAFRFPVFFDADIARILAGDVRSSWLDCYALV